MNWGVVVPSKPGAPPPAPEARPKIPAGSYSRLSKWEKCPLSAYYSFILKMPEPKSPQMERGTRAHADAANILTGKPIDVQTTPLSVPWIKRLGATHTAYGNDVEAELQVAFTQQWERTDWFARDAWCRVIFDALIVTPGSGVMVQEHKTGKPRADHTVQATLYAATAQLLVPDADCYEVTINYLDNNPDGPQGVVRHHFPRDLARKQVAVWTDRVAPMLNDTDYPATPGNHCRWCAFSSKAGGPCEKG
jgi:hypothetical protein